MWGNSNVYLPKEIILKPEEVRYWNGQELSVKPPLIGQINCAPSEADKGMAEKLGIGGAIGVGLLSFFCPPAGIAVAVAYGSVAVGAKVIQHVAKDENVKDGAELFAISFATAATGYEHGTSANDAVGLRGRCLLGHNHK